MTAARIRASIAREWRRSRSAVTARRASIVGLLIVGRLASASATLVTMRLVSPDLFGSFAYLLSTSGLVSSVCMLGIDNTANILISTAGGDAQRRLRQALLTTATLSLIALLLVQPLVTAMVFSIEKGSLLQGGLAACSVGLTSAMLAQGILNGVTFGLGRAFVAPVSGLLVSAVTIGLLLATRPGDLTRLFLVLLASSLAGLLFSGAAVAREVRLRLAAAAHDGPSGAGSRLQIGSALTFGIKNVVSMAAAGACQWLLQGAVIAGPNGPAENARLAFGMQMYNLVVYLPSALGPLVLARQSRTVGLVERRRQTMALSRLFALFAGVAFVAAMAALALVLPLLPGSYGRALPVAGLLCGAACLLILKAPMSVEFQARFTMLPDLLASTAATLVVIVAAWLLPLDALGASVVRAVVNALQLLIVGGLFVTRLGTRAEAPR